MVEYLVRDEGAAGSNPVIPIKNRFESYGLERFLCIICRNVIMNMMVQKEIDTWTQKSEETDMEREINKVVEAIVEREE